MKGYLLLISLINFVRGDEGSTQEVEFTYDNDVMVLDEGNYFQAVEKFEFILMEFYAPWCGHCQKLAPEYEKAAKALKDEGIVLAKVDASVHRKLADKVGIEGYPTLKFSINGQYTKFDGGRTGDGIQQWIWSHINPGSEQLNSSSQVQAAIDSNEVLFFYFADDQPKDEKDREFRRYMEFSYTIRGAKFAHTYESGIREHYKAPRKNNFVVFKQRDQKFDYYRNQKLKIAEMKSFVEINQLPRVLDLDERWDLLQEKVFKKDKPAVFYFDHGDKNEEQQVTFAAYAHPSEEYLLFVKVNYDDERKSELLSKLQIKEDDAKGVFLASKNGTLKFKLKENVEKENIQNFIADWASGKGSRYFKTQDVVEESSGPVTQLSGATYESLVQQSNQDVVVLYYSSKNEEHQLVLKQYDQVALRLAKSNVKFTKIDISQNEVADALENFDVTKVRLYRGESPREIVKFILRANKLQEERIVNWIRENSKSNVSDPKGDL